MTAITRTRLLVLAAAFAPAAAVASTPQTTPTTLTTPAGVTAVQQDSTRRVTQTSNGTVARRPARRTSAARAGEPRAHPRDYVGADSKTCDDLCQRERRNDRLYGKDRERMPGSAQRRSSPENRTP
jgi:hypothetical protein